MAAKKSRSKTTKKAKSTKTHKPKHTSWQDELGIGYATYEHEEEYTSPTEVDEENTNILRSFNQRLAIAPVFVDDES